jgi:hypothetical protein
VTDIPADVVAWVRAVFAEGNARITEKLARNPNTPEESLDLTWIEHLSRYSSPTTLGSEWVVKIESHFLGGMRHFGGWEIADIGMFVFLRLAPEERVSKVALLQSKRLYPNGTPIREELPIDYEIGLARLADPESESLPLGLGSEFKFTDESRYRALRRESDQIDAITAYQEKNRLKVYYQLYNPWTVPFTQTIPLAGYQSPEGAPDLGVRIIPAGTMLERLAEQDGATPKLADLAELSPLPPHGWRLEEFVCDELLGCREGDRSPTTGSSASSTGERERLPPQSRFPSKPPLQSHRSTLRGMADGSQKKVREDAKRAQAKYLRTKGRLDQAGQERRESFERAKAAGLSLAEIGNAVGLHRTRVDQILRGK